ncbi:MAG TPA: acyl carrier protein [Mycobacterium sp.]
MSQTPTTAERVRALIAEHLCVAPEQVTDDAVLTTDLNADSLDVIEVTMAIEEDFDIEIRDDEMNKAETVGCAIQLVERKLVARAA